MSIVLSTTRRIWLILLFWERVPASCADCPRARQTPVVAGGPSLAAGPACPPGCRIVRSLRLHRIVRRRLVGLSLLVLDPRTPAVAPPAP